MCAIALVLASAVTWAQPPAPLGPIGVPEDATALEGRPEVRVETTQRTTTRRELSATEAADSRLTIRIRDGRLYWGADEQPLMVNEAGDFIYLSSVEPGRYLRLRRLNDRLTYVEHVDMGSRAITYWGELRIVLGR